MHHALNSRLNVAVEQRIVAAAYRIAHPLNQLAAAVHVDERINWIMFVGCRGGAAATPANHGRRLLMMLATLVRSFCRDGGGGGARGCGGRRCARRAADARCNAIFCRRLA